MGILDFFRKKGGNDDADIGNMPYNRQNEPQGLKWYVNPLYEPDSQEEQEGAERENAPDIDNVQEDSMENVRISEPEEGKAITHYESILTMLKSTEKNSLLGKDSSQFGDLSSSLSNIIGLLGNSVTSENYPDEYRNIADVYQKAIDCFTVYNESHKSPKTSGGKARKALASTMLGLLKKDFIGIADAGAKIDENTNTTWLEILNRARSVNIDATNSKVIKKGNDGRERYKVDDGEKTSYFTEEIGLYTGAQAAAVAAKDFDPKYAELFSRTVALSYDDVNEAECKNDHIVFFLRKKGFEDKINDEQYCKELVNELFENKIDTGEDDDSPTMIIREGMEKLASEINKRNKNSDLKVDLNDPKFCKTFCEFASKMMKTFKKGQAARGIYDSRNGVNMSKRNVAMSRMADLIGVGSVIARSVNANMTYDGKEMSGNLMESAVGIDHKDNPLMKDTSQMDFSSGNVQKQSTQLQLLDIICGQLDRHVDNIFYDFDKENSKLTKLKGIQGIDNDAAFGKKKDITKEFANFEALNILHDAKTKKATNFSLPLVDEQTGNRILELTYEMVQMVLGDLIPKDQIENTWERIKLLKVYLNELKDVKRPDGKSSRFVKDNEWGEDTSNEMLYDTMGWAGSSKNKDMRDKDQKERFYKKTYYGRIIQGVGEQISLDTQWATDLL